MPYGPYLMDDKSDHAAMQAGRERGRRPWLTQEDPHDVALLVCVKSIDVAPMAVKVPRYSIKESVIAASCCLAVSVQVMRIQVPIAEPASRPLLHCSLTQRMILSVSHI